MPTTQDDAVRIWRICDSVARLYDADVVRAGRAARLLFGTCAQESNFIYRRQLAHDGNPMPTMPPYGAYGLWQCEPGTIRQWLKYLNRHADLDERLTYYVADDVLGRVSQHSLESILKALVGWKYGVRPNSRDQKLADETNDIADRLSACIARGHYLRIPTPIPDSLEDQAKYYKRFYNTPLGKATPEQYLNNYRRLCLPVLTELGIDP